MVPSRGAYRIVSLRSGKCLSLPNDTSSDDTQTYQVDCGTDPGQLWNLNQASGAQGNATQTLAAGPYQILPSTNTSACVDGSGGGAGNGTPVIADNCVTPDVPSQRWQLLPAVTTGGSGYQIVSVTAASAWTSGAARNPPVPPSSNGSAEHPRSPIRCGSSSPTGLGTRSSPSTAANASNFPPKADRSWYRIPAPREPIPICFGNSSSTSKKEFPRKNVTAGLALIYNDMFAPINGYPTPVCLQTDYQTIEIGQCGVVAQLVWSLVQVQTVYGLGYEIQHCITPNYVP